MLGAHESIREGALKYCFPFSHYVTSATMVMTGLVVGESGLRRRYRDQTLTAARSLKTYCHTVWVSGKMMRWVSKLNLLAQRTLADGTVAQNEGGDGLRQRRPDPGGDDRRGVDHQPSNAMLQLTPESEIFHQPGTAADQQRGGATSPCAYNDGTSAAPGWIGHGQERSQQLHQQQQQRASHRAGDRADDNMPANSTEPSGRARMDLSESWLTRRHDIAEPHLAENLPGWAMMYSNFEAIDKGDEFGFRALGNGGFLAGPCAADVDIRVDESMDVDRDGTAGWLPRLGIDVDQALLELFGTACEGF